MPTSILHVLRHLTALKLNEEEVEALGGEEQVTELGVPELLLTHGSNGALLISRGVRERDPRAAHRPRRPDRRGRCVPRRVRLGASGPTRPVRRSATRGHDGRTRVSS